MKRLLFVIGINLFHACVTPDQKISLVHATALDELNCGDNEINIADLGNDRFSVQCGPKQASYSVNCPGGPNTCQIKRSR